MTDPSDAECDREAERACADKLRETETVQVLVGVDDFVCSGVSVLVQVVDSDIVELFTCRLKDFVGSDLEGLRVLQHFPKPVEHVVGYDAMGSPTSASSSGLV